MVLFQKTKALCAQYGIKPARSKGQNFLIQEEIYERIVAAAEIQAHDKIIEVGPGLGFLTAKLAAKAKQITAIELDDKLASYLKSALISKKIDNVVVINQDVMKFDIRNLIMDEKIQRESSTSLNMSANNNASQFDQISNIKYPISSCKIVANLPYNITSQFLRKFLESELRPELMVLMLQKEVAQRIIAKPGEMSLLSVSVQFYALPEIIEFVPASAFWPVPEIDSAVIRLTTNSDLPLKSDEIRDFFRMVKFGFSARRKMLKNNLAGAYKISQNECASILNKAGLKEKARAQDLSLQEWVHLFGYFK